MRLRSGKLCKSSSLSRKKSVKSEKRREIEIIKENRTIIQREKVRRVKVHTLMNEYAARQEPLNESVSPLPRDSDSDDNNDDDEANITLIEQKPRKMSEFLTKVNKLKIEGNLSDNWRRFKRNFDIFMTAGELTTKSDEIKINTFLNAVGEEAVEIFDSFNLPEENRTVYDDVIKSFAEFCSPKKKHCLRTIRVLSKETKGRRAI